MRHWSKGNIGDFLPGLALSFFIVTLGMVSVSCANTVASNDVVLPPTPQAGSAGTRGDDGPNVRIISLDFDPRVDEDGTCDGLTNRTLLVAVDNQSKQSEKNVIVNLEIRDPSDSNKGVLLSQSQTISTLSSGEVKVIKFTGFTMLQKLPSYDLAVNINAVSGERKTDDNRKSMILRISN